MYSSCRIEVDGRPLGYPRNCGFIGFSLGYAPAFLSQVRPSVAIDRDHCLRRAIPGQFAGALPRPTRQPIIKRAITHEHPNFFSPVLWRMRGNEEAREIGRAHV